MFIDYLESTLNEGCDFEFEIEIEEGENTLDGRTLVHECGHAAAFLYIAESSAYERQFSEIRIELYPGGAGRFSYFLSEGRLNPMTVEEKVLVAVAGPVWEYVAEFGLSLEEFNAADFVFAMYSELQFASDLEDIKGMVSAEEEMEIMYSSAQLAAELYSQEYDTVLVAVASQLMPYMGGEVAVLSIEECLSW